MIVRSTMTPIKPDDDRRHHQHGDPDVDADLVRLDGGVAAEHQELAMREVDDLHHAEDDREPDADQRQARHGVKNLDRQERREIQA